MADDRLDRDKPERWWRSSWFAAVCLVGSLPLLVNRTIYYSEGDMAALTIGLTFWLTIWTAGAVAWVVGFVRDRKQ